MCTIKKVKIAKTYTYMTIKLSDISVVLFPHRLILLDAYRALCPLFPPPSEQFLRPPQVSTVPGMTTMCSILLAGILELRVTCSHKTYLKV